MGDRDTDLEIAMARHLLKLGEISSAEFEKCVVELKKLQLKKAA